MPLQKIGGILFCSNIGRSVDHIVSAQLLGSVGQSTKLQGPVEWIPFSSITSEPCPPELSDIILSKTLLLVLGSEDQKLQVSGTLRVKKIFTQ